MDDKLMEPMINKIKSMLEDGSTGMASKISAINAEKGDFTLEDIKRVYKGAVQITSEIPCQVIWPEDPPGGVHTNVTEFISPTIIIWTVCVGDDPENSHIRGWRYQRATYEVIQASDNLEGVVDICKFAGLRFKSPWVFNQEKAPFFNVVGVAFAIENEEDAA